MKECHNTINKVLAQLSSSEVLDYTTSKLVLDPIYKEYPQILTHLRTKCKVCNSEYSFLVKSQFIEK